MGVKTETKKMEIKMMNIDNIIPYVNNPRHNENAVDKVASSIKEFGFKVPIVIDKDNVIVTGHTRLLASKKLGLTEVPCVVASDLTKAQIKAFRIADNKVSEYSSWDNDLLRIELEGLKELDFDIELTGFNEIDMMEMFEDIIPDDEDYNIDEYDEVSEETLKAGNIVISYFNEEEYNWIMNLFRETNFNKKLFKVEEIKNRYEEK